LDEDDVVVGKRHHDGGDGGDGDQVKDDLGKDGTSAKDGLDHVITGVDGVESPVQSTDEHQCQQDVVKNLRTVRHVFINTPIFFFKIFLLHKRFYRFTNLNM